MDVVGLDRGFDGGKRQRAVAGVVERLRLHAAQHRAAAGFVAVGVRLLPDDVLVAARAMRHHADEVRLRAGGHEHRSLEPQQRGGLGLQRIDAGIVAENVVAHGRGGHDRAHRRGGPGYGVGAKVGRHSLLLTRSYPRCSPVLSAAKPG